MAKGKDTKEENGVSEEPTSSTSQSYTTLIPPFPCSDGKVFGNGFEVDIVGGEARLSGQNAVISILVSEGWKVK
jgi:hypothetical protein